jgi:hypothetical protein
MLRKVRLDLAVQVHCTQKKESHPRKKEWCAKPTKADRMTSAGTNMVFILPLELYAPDHKELPVALYLKGYINGHLVNKMLVDTGAAVNIMPYSVLRRLGRFAEDLIKTNIMLSDFNGQASEAQGILNVDLTVGSKTVLTSFFIVRSKNTYTVLLRRDWIHANCCIRSMMHQCLIQWDGDEVEVVHADDLIEMSLAAMSV